LEAVAWTLIVLLFLLAYAGLLIPAVPDVPLVLAGFAIYHFLIGSVKLGWGFWVTMVILTLLLAFVEYAASSIAVRKYGGSRWAMTAAVAGMILFPFVLGPVGVIVGPFVLVFLVEWAQNKAPVNALRVAFSTLLGFLGGVFVKFIVMSWMIVWFLVKVL
jgi:uncharacterized protein